MVRLLIFPLILTTSFALGQTKISGRITDTKNHPLEGVSITIEDSYDGATSDSTGNFSFVTSEKGTQTISATASG
ncbi:MAG TPA: carboxypeptidase regulatory-like domain-containing protein [Hanamia sp.]|nr:carboxypeptidase regulatory-like domain-containing protein [Hanamia sp.]